MRTSGLEGVWWYRVELWPAASSTSSIVDPPEETLFLSVGMGENDRFEKKQFVFISAGLTTNSDFDESILTLWFSSSLSCDRNISSRFQSHLQNRNTWIGKVEPNSRNGSRSADYFTNTCYLPVAGWKHNIPEITGCRWKANICCFLTLDVFYQ